MQTYRVYEMHEGAARYFIGAESAKQAAEIVQSEEWPEGHPGEHSGEVTADRLCDSDAWGNTGQIEVWLDGSEVLTIPSDEQKARANWLRWFESLKVRSLQAGSTDTGEAWDLLTSAAAILCQSRGQAQG